MSDASRYPESGQIEIFLVAVGVLVLVLAFGILVLVCAGLGSPSRGYDPENGRRLAASRAHRPRQDIASSRPYRDYENSFIDSFRRQSQSLTEDFKLEMHNLRQSMATLMTPSGSQNGNSSVVDRMRRFSLDNLLTFSTNSSDLITDCESCCEFLDSPLAATGREDAAGARRRSSRLAGNTVTPDLEAQQ
ncbi:hypothetical protein CDV31_010663 [Fusarium ambrosium]|uniref:Uncharacterized protein n=1 Tax=Fusarium ambrosium TaxID=131363 RepID=A0A428TM15_9HYPO|nr:hypothetical protein CDV31_010663 [Fusarium ambrosium]